MKTKSILTTFISIIFLVLPLTAEDRATEIRFGTDVTLTGTIEQIKTYDDDGKAVFPFYLTTDNKIIVRPAIDFDPGDTNEVLDGMEVLVIEGKESDLEPFRGKRVTIKGSVSTGTNLYCFGFGLYVESVKVLKSARIGDRGSRSAISQLGWG